MFRTFGHRGIALLGGLLAEGMAPSTTLARPAPTWLVWTALGIVYVVWGSTYLAIRVTVDTMPPFLAGGVRFLVAGGVLFFWLVARRGWKSMRVSRREFMSASVVGGALLIGGNGLVMVAEQDVPSGLAALLIASVPLWVIVLRKLTGERVSGGTLIGVGVGFAGVALLVTPSGRPGAAQLAGIGILLIASLSWASGSFFAGRLPLPKDPFTSTAIQMLVGGAGSLLIGLIAGEGSEVQVDRFSTASIVALAYLISIGSWLAFTAYVWVLQNAPISKVATYAYVNPVIAIFLGWMVLSEEITTTMLVGATVILASVAGIVRKESGPRRAPEGVEAAPGALAGVDAS